MKLLALIVGTSLAIITLAGPQARAASQNPQEPAQTATNRDARPGSLENAPRSEQPAPPIRDNESSSKSTKVNLAPPAGEPDFRTGGGDVDVRAGVNETKPWNPHKSDKDVEVGDFYYKRQNYRAAESRYREALYWMDNNALASFRLAQTLEQLGRYQEATKYYRQYLGILPRGAEANEAHKGIDRLANKPESSR
ncbi:MAG TPA: tetratricopeptide repeat protein [Anaerolineales bacterium]